MKVLGLINARGGSKGVPGKNYKPLLGRPLIEYSIEAGLSSSLISRVIVSTDHEGIADIARNVGAEVPFMRPGYLAEDNTLQIDVIHHALSFLEDNSEHYDAVCILQPTCPMRTAKDIDGAIELMSLNNADTVISVTQVTGYHPATYYIGSPDEGLTPYMSTSGAGVLRQELPAVWWRNGAIYLVRTEIILNERVLYGDKVMGYQMPSERSVNIDEPLDWTIAEVMLSNQLSADNN